MSVHVSSRRNCPVDDKLVTRGNYALEKQKKRHLQFIVDSWQPTAEVTGGTLGTLGTRGKGVPRVQMA